MRQRSLIPDSSYCLETDLDGGFAQVRLIVAKMRRHLPSHADLDDMIGDGLLGLVEAARRYDPARNVAFRTFAEHRIRGAIGDGLRRLDPLPRQMRQRQRAAEHTVAALTARLGRSPHEEELARHMRLSPVDWRKIALLLWHAGSPVNGDRGCAPPPVPVEQLPTGDGNPEQQTARQELRQLLARAIETLPERQQTVIRLLYGGDWRMREIAAVLGVGESRVSQLHTDALKRLRQVLAGHEESLGSA